MGESISRAIYVDTIDPIQDVDAEVVAADVIDEPDDQADMGAQQKNENTGSQQNLQQQINNPFTFIPNGDNNTQIGYIANHTIIKK